MAMITIEVDDDLAKYLQAHANEHGILLADVLSEMISEDLALSHEREVAINLLGGSGESLLLAAETMNGLVDYQKKTIELMEADSLPLFTLRKIDARLPEGRTRSGFLCDLMDGLVAVR